MRLTKNTEIVSYEGDRLTVKNKRGKISNIDVDDLQFDTWIEKDPHGESDYDQGVLQIVTMKLSQFVLDTEGYEIQKSVKFDKDFVEKFSLYLADGYDWGAYMNSYYEAERDYYNDLQNSKC